MKSPNFAEAVRCFFSIFLHPFSSVAVVTALLQAQALSQESIVAVSEQSQKGPSPFHFLLTRLAFIQNTNVNTFLLTFHCQRVNSSLVDHSKFLISHDSVCLVSYGPPLLVYAVMWKVSSVCALVLRCVLLLLSQSKMLLKHHHPS